MKANCPKTHVQCGVAPIPKKNANKREKTPKEKEGDVKRTTFGLRKRGQQKKNRKTRKNPPHRSREAIFERDPKSTEKNDTAAHLPRAKFARAADTLPKRRFSKRARFCSPRGFLTFETQFRQNFEHRTVQNSNLRKKFILKTGPQKGAFSTRPKGSKRYRDAKWLRNPLFCSVSCVSTSTAALARDSRPESRKKGFREGWPKKRAKTLEKGPFCKKVDFAFFPSSPIFREKRSPHFAL